MRNLPDTGSAPMHTTTPGPIPKEMVLARAMTLAFTDAGLGPEDIDYINAHGTTQSNDRTRPRDQEGPSGARWLPPAVSSTKSMLGHMLGAVGAVEAAVTALAFRRDHPAYHQL